MYCLSERLLPSQEGLFSVELVCYKPSIYLW